MAPDRSFTQPQLAGIRLVGGVAMINGTVLLLNNSLDDTQKICLFQRCS